MKKAVISDSLSYQAPLLVDISNQLVEDFKKLFDLQPFLPVEYFKWKGNIEKIKVNKIPNGYRTHV